MMNTAFLAGMGKADITVYQPGMCLFGWGQPNNIARDVAAPLFARALIVRSASGGDVLAYVCADLGFISQHLRQRVVELAQEQNLGLGEHSIMLSATHTHSGPNGYSDYLFYGVTGPGFSPHVLEGLAQGIVAALEQALRHLAPATLRWIRTAVPLTESVAFNRSLDAYNCNHDVEPVGAGRSDEAVDRHMVVLRVDQLDGPCGFVCWFPTHGTSIHHENTSIHPDNKGVAARICEDKANALAARAQPFVAIFAQEAAGDVTPNFRWDARRQLLVGRYDNDFESAEHAGGIQARHAWNGFVEAYNHGTLLHGNVECRVRYKDFGNAAVHPDFAEGKEEQTTSIACLGLGFTYGTLEGPGPGFLVRNYNQLLSNAVVARRRLRKRPDWRTMHGPKVRFFDLGRGLQGNIMTVLPAQPKGFNLIPDRRVAYYRQVLQANHLGMGPWVPHILPLQIMRIGQLAIVGLPLEPTTVSGRRVRAVLLSALAPRGVEHVVVNGYANAYASYMTTHEEYQLQRYEGACTLFGQWTLGAFCTELRTLAQDMVDGTANDLAILPPRSSGHRLLPQAAMKKGTPHAVFA